MPVQLDESGQSENALQPTPPTERPSVVVPRSGAFLMLVILSCFGVGLAIYWLLRTMHI